ncbi:MAG: Ldh family oxidoreductase, partial [Geminicoccaceae bacterium]
MPTDRFSSDDLRGFSSDVFRAAGLRSDDADIVAEDLVRANFRGLDSHGVSRLPMYVHRIQSGLVNPKPDIRVEDET